MANKFSFEHALSALQMGPPALRRWIALRLIGNMAKTGGGALEFAPHDLAVLALVKAMVEYGMAVAVAHKNAVRIMREAGPWSGDEPPEAYWTAWAPDTQFVINRVVGKNGKPAWHIAKFEHAEPAFGAFLMIIPHALIRAVLERAIEAAETRVAKKRTA